ncbi:MAG TPA: YbhB/YbcL family Raf kinase inhibitor-like protein [Pseudolabrys sp.]|nr:YbhB/YbcL family Raf kinase inhibitor-like protein [Pseudolabrys sp.]
MPRAALSTTGESSTSRRAAFREGFASADRPDSIRTAINDFGEPEYGGPAPPQKHGTHHYHFKLAALDVESIDPPASVKVADLWKKASDHIIAQAELVGTYSRS